MSRRLQRPASCATAIATNWFQRVMLRSFRPLWCRFASDSNSCLGTSFEKLRENRAIVGHGLNILVFD